MLNLRDVGRIQQLQVKESVSGLAFFELAVNPAKHQWRCRSDGCRYRQLPGCR
jgi:hypothetical protein